MQDDESKYPLLREFHTRRDWVQLRGTPSGGWTVFIGDSIGVGLWQWMAAYSGSLRDALSVYHDEFIRTRQSLVCRGYDSLEELLTADLKKKGGTA